jgi:hypothetical protein
MILASGFLWMTLDKTFKNIYPPMNADERRLEPRQS